MKCGFCRNEFDDLKERKWEGDFIFYLCEGCGTRYEEYPQLGPKYLVCLCNPDNPREVEIEMAKTEVKSK